MAVGQWKSFEQAETIAFYKPSCRSLVYILPALG